MAKNSPQPGRAPNAHAARATDSDSASDARARFSRLLDSFLGVVFEYDPEIQRFDYVSENAEALLGYPLDEWREPGFWRARLHPDDAERTAVACSLALNERRDHVLEYRMVARDGRTVWIHEVVRVADRGDGTPLLAGLLFDVTSHHGGERVLREILAGTASSAGEEFLVRLTAHLGRALGARNALISERSPDGAQLLVRALWDRETGAERSGGAIVLRDSPCELVLRDGFTAIDGDLLERFPDVARILPCKPRSYVGAPLVSRAGESFGTVAVLFDSSAPSLHVIRPILEMFVSRASAELERTRAERRALESEQRMREVINALPDKVFVFDREGRYLHIHIPPSMTPLAPTESLVGRKMRDVMPPEISDVFMGHLEETFRTGLPQAFERVVPIPGGDRIYEFRILPFGEDRVLKIGRDVTESRRLEAQLRQSQKMESIGRLAGGVAHDFNNLLTGILSYAELAEEYAGDSPQLVNALEKIRKAGEAAAQLTQHLLTFARKQVAAPQVLALAPFVRDIEGFLRRVIGEHIELNVVVEAETDAVRVLVDPVQLQQIVLNLVINARDALRSNGRIWIEVGALDVASPADEGCAPGRYARLTVIDNGVGMDDETRARLFEPFFTTKELGRGAGLGLATCYGIVRQNGGFLRVQSEPGAGARIDVCLPLVVLDESQATTRSKSSKRGHEAILLVEDQDLVREVLGEALSALGYRVTAVADGLAALAAVDAAGGARAFDVLVTDLVLPHLDGGSLAMRLRGSHPGLRVLYMSGYSTDQGVAALYADRSDFLRKPVTPSVISERVRELCASPVDGELSS